MLNINAMPVALSYVTLFGLSNVCSSVADTKSLRVECSKPHIENPEKLYLCGNKYNKISTVMTKREAEEIAKLRTSIQTYRKKCHSSTQKNRDMQKSRDKYKAENKELKNENEILKAKLQRLEEELKKRIISPTVGESIDRHKYNSFIVKICVEMYVHLRLGLRTTRAMIEYLSRTLRWYLVAIPSAAGIKNRVEKSGYRIYTEPEVKDSQEPYAQIID
jgi:hypothetical protein